MTIALFLGRFQPLHKGHLYVIKKILEEHSFVKIAVGSSQYFNMSDNPFSSLERTEMIRFVLEKEGITKFDIFLVPDIHDDLAYVDHLIKIVGKVDTVYAIDNKNTKELFSDEGYEVVTMKRYQDISSEKIRELMMHNDDSWKELVPELIVDYMDSVDGVEKVREAS